MRVRDLMTKNVRVCNVYESVNRATQMMWEADCGCIPVVDGGAQVIGIITDRDALMAAYTTGQVLSDIPVSTAMSKRVFTVRADDPLDVAEALMQRHRIRRLPVTDLAGRLVGVLSLNDIARGLHRTGDPVRASQIAATMAAICEAPPAPSGEVGPPRSNRARAASARS